MDALIAEWLLVERLYLKLTEIKVTVHHVLYPFSLVQQTEEVQGTFDIVSSLTNLQHTDAIRSTLS